MKKYQIQSLILASLLLVFSCQKEHKSAASAESMENSEKVEYSDAVAQQNPEGRLFHKKADFRFEVQDVFQSVKKIEYSVIGNSGYILESNLDNTILEDKEVVLSKDSIKRYVKTYADATILARAPQNQMLEIIENIEKEIALLNHRNLQAEELTFTYEYQKEKADRLAENAEDMAKVAHSKGKVEDKIEGVEKLAQIREDKSRAKKKFKELKDNTEMVDFAIHVRGPEVMQSFMQTNFHTMDTAQTPFGYQFKNAMISGWNVFQKILISLLSIWPLWLLVALGFFGYKNRRKLAQSFK